MTATYSSSKEDPTSNELDELSLCCLCGETFSNPDSLHRHFTTSHDEKSSLPDFPYSTNSPSSCRSGHSQQMEFEICDSGPRTYICDFCQKSFTKSCNLNSHVKAVHNGVKGFRCPDCSKSFSRNSDLQKHIDAVHKGLRPYECSICRKLFSQKSSLKRHREAVHDGIKAFLCVQCGSRFSYDVHLKRHIRAKHKSAALQSSNALFQQSALPPQAST